MKIKIILSVSTIILLGLVLFVISIMQAMSVEDHYGDSQNFYFKSKQGDIIINKSTEDLKQLSKSWTRIYYIDNNDTVDLFHWLTDSKVELYRPISTIENIGELTFDDIQNLLNQRKLELVIKN